MSYTIAQTEQLQGLREDFDVRFAMTYGEPRIDKVIREMKESGVEDITVLPLYPQYSLTTVEPIIQQVKKIDDKINVIRDFHQIESYTDLLACLLYTSDAADEL